MNFQPLIDYVENVLRAEKKVPGCDLKIMRNHETLFRYHSGFSDYEGTQPVSGNELYIMYSCTKPVTCAAALQLVEQGKLALDAPASSYLPELSQVFLLKDGIPTPPKNPITVRHLLTMSAGFSYNLKAQPVQQALADHPHATTREMVAHFIKSPLLFEPGHQFEYSLCHDILAAVIEAASGQRFSDYLKENIFTPLGMQNTGFVPSDAQRCHLAAQYACLQSGRVDPTSITNGYQLTDCYESGGAGLFSSLEDYSRFADAMANGGIGITGAQILQPQTIDLMRTEQLSRFVKEDTFGTCAGHGYGYGMGVRTLISKDLGQRSSLGEFGWDGAAGSYLMVDPNYGLSITFTMQVLGWPTCIGDGRDGLGHVPIRDLTYEILGL